MRTFKHLPSKPTLVQSIRTQPYIRKQHYRPRQEQLIKAKVKSLTTDKLTQSGLTVFSSSSNESILSVMERFSANESLLNQLNTDDLVALYGLAKVVDNHDILNLLSKRKVLGTSDFLIQGAYKLSQALQSVGISKTQVLDLVSETLTSFLENVEHSSGKKLSEHLQEELESGLLHIDFLRDYIETNTPTNRALTLMFDITMRKRKGKQKLNQIEKLIANVYDATQALLKEYTPKELGLNENLIVYRGMVLRKPKPESGLISSTSVEKGVAEEFINGLYSPVGSYMRPTTEKELKQRKINIDLSNIKKTTQIRDVEYFTNTENDIGVLLTLQPKREQIFAILTEEALNKLTPILGVSEDDIESLISTVQEYDEKEVLVRI